MRLVQWQHPTNQSIRLYVNELFAGQNSKTKAWFEESDRNRSGFILKTSGEYQSLATSNAALKRMILGGLELAEDAGWDDLLAKALAMPASRGRNPAARAAARRMSSGPALQDRAQEALDLDIASIRMPGPVTIHVDHREPEALVDRLRQHAMITVVADSALPLGDVVVEDPEGNQLIIERKRCDDAGPKTDFEVSVQDDSRLFDQSERLKFAAAGEERQVIPVVILEGDVYRNATTMLCQQIDGAISFLSAVQRISVLPTYNLNHTAYLVAKLATHFVDGLLTPVSLHKSKPKVLFEQQRYVLESMPGISSKIAEALLCRFGTVRGVMTASEDELLSVHGLGKKKVTELLRVLGSSAF